MATYPNQKSITIHNDSSERIKTLAGGWHVIINEIDSQAMKELSGSAYKLYSYLRKNMNGYRFDLSQKAATAYTGISKNSYANAVTELIQKRFMIPCPDRNNTYDFYLYGDSTIIKPQ